MKIRAEIVNPFIEAGMNVIKELTNVDVRRGHLTYRTNPAPAYEVSILLGVYGFLDGQVVYSMKKEVAVQLVRKMLGDEATFSMKELFINTLGELANMITGNALALLNTDPENGLNISTPTIITGTKVSVNTVTKPTIVLGMYTPYGPIEINIALDEAGASAGKARSDIAAT